MKRIYLVLAVLSAWSLHASEGWRLYNNTDKPIAYAWYKTKIAGYIPGYEKAFGFKERISNVTTIEPHSEKFVVLSPEQGKMGGYKTRREFILAVNATDLTPSIEADDKGQTKNKALVVTDKNQFGKPYAQGDKNKPIIYVMKAAGPQGISWLLHVSEGWKFYNNTDKRIGYAWVKTKISGIPGYETVLDPDPKAKEKISEVMFIEAYSEKFVELPPDQGTWGGYKTRRELFLGVEDPKLTTSGENLVLTDKIKLGKPYAQGDKNKPIIYVLAAAGPQPILLSGQVIGSAKGAWNFENLSGRPLYYAWFTAEWDDQKKYYTDPHMMGGENVNKIPAKARVSVQMPIQQVLIKEVPIKQKLMRWVTTDETRHLLFSYDEHALTSYFGGAESHKKRTGGNLINNDDPKVSIYSPSTLGATGSPLKVYKFDERAVVETEDRKITLINTTNEELFAAMYYVDLVDEDSALRTGGNVVSIAPQMGEKIKYPLGNLGKDIQLFVARKDQKKILQKAILSKNEMTQLARKSFKATNIANWYRGQPFNIIYDVTKSKNKFLRISSAGGALTGSSVEGLYNIAGFDPADIQKLEQLVETPEYQPSRAIKKAAAEQDGKSIITGLDKLELENDFVKIRSELKVREAINKLLKNEGVQIPRGQAPPKIAIAFTGGGYRAMVETIGFLRGAEEIGLFDTCMYMSGLSGSTWAINPLVVSDKSPTEFAELQSKKVRTSGEEGYGPGSFKPLIKNALDNEEWTVRRFVQSRFNQYYGPIGLYGHAIANAVLDGYKLNGKTTHNITLSDLRTNLSSGEYPLPLSVSVDPGKAGVSGKAGVCGGRLWFEFSPFYIGIPKIPRAKHGLWVDTKLFGCTYKDRSIRHFVPEYPLAQYMGIWGSAFALSAADIGKESAWAGMFAKVLGMLKGGAEKLYDLALWREPEDSPCAGRVTAGQIPNFAFGDDRLKLKEFKDKSVLCLVDGGMVKDKDCRHNFSTIPPLARDIDLLILCDSPEQPNKDTRSEHLQAASQEAKGLLDIDFPESKRGTISDEKLKEINGQVSTLLLESGKKLIVVYMKGKKIPGNPFDPDSSISPFTATANFDYSTKQFNQLAGLTTAIMTDPATVANIKKALKEAVKRQGN